jgi:GNAT superfamily N-acetyltransferase
MSGSNFDLFSSATPDVLDPLEALADDLNQLALVSPCSNDAAHVAMVASPDTVPVRPDALTTAATRNAEPTATADPASAASSTKAASKCTQEEMMLPCETLLLHDLSECKLSTTSEQLAERPLTRAGPRLRRHKADDGAGAVVAGVDPACAATQGKEAAAPMDAAANRSLHPRDAFTDDQQKEILLKAFDREAYPSDQQTRELSEQLDMTTRQVQVWFQNRRARLKHTKIKHEPDKKTGETAEAADHGVRTPTAATPTAATPAAATRTLAQVPTLDQSTEQSHEAAAEPTGRRPSLRCQRSTPEPSHEAAAEPTDAISAVLKIAPPKRLRPTADPAATRKSARTNGDTTAPKHASQPLPKAAAPDKEPEPLPTPTIGLAPWAPGLIPAGDSKFAAAVAAIKAAGANEAIANVLAAAAATAAAAALKVAEERAAARERAAATAAGRMTPDAKTAAAATAAATASAAAAAEQAAEAAASMFPNSSGTVTGTGAAAAPEKDPAPKPAPKPKPKPEPKPEPMPMCPAVSAPRAGHVGKIVWAKMDGFPYWPAALVAPTSTVGARDGCTWVRFFGTADFGWARHQLPWEAHREQCEREAKSKLKGSKRLVQFRRGVAEAENERAELPRPEVAEEVETLAVVEEEEEAVEKEKEEEEAVVELEEEKVAAAEAPKEELEPTTLEMEAEMAEADEAFANGSMCMVCNDEEEARASRNAAVVAEDTGQQNEDERTLVSNELAAIRAAPAELEMMPGEAAARGERMKTEAPSSRDEQTMAALALGKDPFELPRPLAASLGDEPMPSAAPVMEPPSAPATALVLLLSSQPVEPLGPAYVSLEATEYDGPHALPPLAPPMALVDELGIDAIDVECEAVAADEAAAAAAAAEAATAAQLAETEAALQMRPASPIDPCAEGDDDEDRLMAAGGRGAVAAMELEERHCDAEAAGELRFELVRFDGLEQHGPSFSTAVLLKELFRAQLPEMDDKYFTKCLLDPKNVAMACISRGVLSGGLLYRPHPAAAASVGPLGMAAECQHVGDAAAVARHAPAALDKSSAAAAADANGAAALLALTAPLELAQTESSTAFAELLLFSVESSRQVQGLGTRLMNRLKAQLLQQRIGRILAYADQFALSFFHCQGFTHRVLLSPDAYKGVIGEFEGAVLMECVLYPELPYTRLPRLIRLARHAVLRERPDARLNARPRREGKENGGDKGERSGRRSGVSASIIKHGGGSHVLSSTLGRHLEAALERSGRQLAHPDWLSTDFGCGVGTRLVPVEYGHSALLESGYGSAVGGGGGSSAVAAALDGALQQTLAQPNLASMELRALCSADERRMCRFYIDTPQLLADVHRLGLAPFAATAGPLRSAFAHAAQALTTALPSADDPM